MHFRKMHFSKMRFARDRPEEGARVPASSLFPRTPGDLHRGLRGRQEVPPGGAFSKNAFSKNAFFENFANFWRARSRLYQNEILQQNMRLTAFFKLYKICILLHRCNLKIFAKNRFEKLRISQIFRKISQILANSTIFF